MDIKVSIKCEVCSKPFLEKDLFFKLNEVGQYAHVNCLESIIDNLKEYFETLSQEDLAKSIFVIKDGKMVSIYTLVQKALKKGFHKEANLIEFLGFFA